MKDVIKAFIVKTFLYGKGTIGDDEQLFESGLIDSMGLIKLLAFIEKNLGVSLNMSEIMIANFDTVSKIAAFVAAKKGVKQ